MNPTCKYKLHVQDVVETELMGHAVFLTRFSPTAAARLIKSFDECLDNIEANPLMYQIADDMDVAGIPPNEYRRCIFMKNYKIVFRIEGETIFVISVIDARAENKGLFGNEPDQAREPAGGT